MPSTSALIKAYGNIPIPHRIDDMTYVEAQARGILSSYEIRYDLMALWERDVETIRERQEGEKQ